MSKEKHENSDYLFEELKTPNFEHDFFSNLPNLEIEKEEIQLTKSYDDIRLIGDMLGIDWESIDINELQRGVEIEMEHGKKDFQTNVTNDDLLTTVKIALAHLKEYPDYYKRLSLVEQEDFWEKVERLYNEYTHRQDGLDKNKIILFVLTRAKDFQNKHTDIFEYLPEVAIKKIIHKCIVAGLMDSKVVFKLPDSMDEMIRDTYLEIGRRLNLLSDNSEKLEYNDISSVLDEEMKKMLNCAKSLAWGLDTFKDRYDYIIKSKNGFNFIDLSDLDYLIKTNGNIFEIERFLRKEIE